MLTSHKIKLIQSLDKKKFRQKYNLFLVEGNKNIVELQNSSYKIKELFSVNPEELNFLPQKIVKVSESELRKISFLKNPKNSIAICEIPEENFIEGIKIQIVLDGIQDPGNLGTIIRLADWFGITQIVCSEDTADLYNPKVIMSTMGSFARVNVIYKDLSHFIQNSENQNIGTGMEGENIYEFEFPDQLNLIFGNEGNGIRQDLKDKLDTFVTIPRFGKSQSTESLNVSMATGIILGEIFSKK